MSVRVRDAKIYVKELGQIVIGYETKGSTILFSLKETDCCFGIKGAYVCLEITTDKWLIEKPRIPRALSKNRADIYIDMKNVTSVIKMCETINRAHQGIKETDCPELSSSFFPSGLEEGQKKLPQGYNFFRAPITDACFEIRELSVRLKPIGAELFIDYESSDKTHLFQFSTPALHFALRAPLWLKEQTEIDDSKWSICIDIKCEKAILNAIKRIATIK